MRKKTFGIIKKALYIFLSALFLISATTVFVSSNTESQLENTCSKNVTIYVVPAITDNKILPKSLISPSYISDTISVKASPGEFEPSSFVIHTNQDINSTIIESTNLTGSGGTIPSTNVNIRVVKCWYQGGYSDDGDLGVSGRYLTPELLLKDDSMVKVTGEDWNQWNISNSKGKNYLKLTNGSFIDISKNGPQNSDFLIIPITKRPISDATTLQPVTLRKGYNKQFLITLSVPNNANAGNYSGFISIRTGTKIIRQLQLNLQIFPIVLAKPNMEYSLYYIGMITKRGSISSEDKSTEQFNAELKDMLDHGVTNPTCISIPTNGSCAQILSTRNNVGLNNTNLYLTGLSFGCSSELTYYQKLTAPYGVTNLYVYGPDEKNINNAFNRSQMAAIHNAGGKVMDSQKQYDAGSVADILDLAVVSGVPSAELSNKYHNYGHKIYSYANPQVVPEYPRLYRMNYGLLLWQKNYDGTMNYAYQHSFGDIWNDFDCNCYRDHVFAYPTMNGVIDTIQWEGFREGVDDVRYLTTLQNTISLAKKQGMDTSEAENWLANLKSSDLRSQDLDSVRSQIINYTISLQNHVSLTQGGFRCKKSGSLAKSEKTFTIRKFNRFH